MSLLSQFVGGSGGGASGHEIGEIMQSITAPAHYIVQGVEYLKSGNIIAYTPAYATALAANLGVYGSDATQPDAIAGTAFTSGWTFRSVGSTYIAISGASPSQPMYSTDLINWTTSTGLNQAGYQGVTSNSTYCVVDGFTGVYYTPFFTSSGTTWTIVGGNFSANTSRYTAGAFGNNVWIMGRSLIGNAAELAYINNANPSGTWTITSANKGMNPLNGIVFGNGVFLAVGGSASPSIGKLATTTDPVIGWTDQTATCGLGVGQNDAFSSPVFDGTHFYCLWNISGRSRLVKSADGATWTQVLVSSGDNLLSQPGCSLFTDGAGRLITQANTTFYYAANKVQFATSSDGGLNWQLGQFYSGKGPGSGTTTVTYTNNGWLVDIMNATPPAPLRLGSLDMNNPGYIGLQYLVSQITPITTGTGFGAPQSVDYPAHVRIK